MTPVKQINMSRADIPRLLLVADQKVDADDLEAAEQLYRAVVEIAPDSFVGWAGLATVAQHRGLKEGRAFEGLEYLQRAMELRRMPPLMNDVANCIMYNERRYRDAAPLYREAAIRHKDVSAAAHYAICLLMLANEDNTPQAWREAWDWYEWRHMKSKLSAPGLEYRGEDVQGKTVLVNFEQGYGDQIFGLRYLKTLYERGAKVITLCDHNMRRLVAAQPYVAHAWDEAKPAQITADFNVMLMSLAPYCLPDCLPMQSYGFVCVPGMAANQAARKRVGLCWRGSTGGSYPGWRNVPPDMLRPLIASRPDFEWISLQHGGHDSGLPIDHDSVEACDDMLDTARLTATLDLVITCDTMTPHLAAGVGVPVWLMDRWSSSWQWTEEGSRWYALVSTFRQPEHGAWQPVVDEIAHRISFI
jgi:hypothetical protein